MDFVERVKELGEKEKQLDAIKEELIKIANRLLTHIGESFSYEQVQQVETGRYVKKIEYNDNPETVEIELRDIAYTIGKLGEQ